MADAVDHTHVSRSAQPGGKRGALALGSGLDRERSFRRARRHTIVVRSLRILLPTTAVALFASYGIFVQRSFKKSKAPGQLKVQSMSISTEALVAHHPRYEGFDKQGGKFNVHAVTGEQDIGQQGPVRLKTIDGRMTDAGGSVTDLTAVSGTYDTKSSVLELYQEIHVIGRTNGMTADLTRATVLSKESYISSNEPVVVRMPSGTVHGKTLVIEQKKHQVTFGNGVIAHLKQEPSKDKPAAEKAAAKAPAAGTSTAGFGQSDAPVDITSVKLFIDDLAKTAIFTGTVVAKQNDAVLETPQLDVIYEGQPTGAAATKPADAAAAPAGPGAASKIKRMIARNQVTLTRGTERAISRNAEFDTTTDTGVLLTDVVVTSGPERQATGDRLDFDNRKDTSILTGNVVVTQVKNVLKGRRLFVDRKANTMLMTAPAVTGMPKGRVTARLYQADNANQPGKATTPAGQPAEQPKGGVQLTALRGDPSKPIDIEADSLFVDDNAKTATFRGQVIAVQGDYKIRTEELVAIYAGDAGAAIGAPDAKGGPTAQAAGPKPAGSAQLQKVRATKRAIVTTTDGRTATGNSADFDTKANTVTLVGDVMLTQGNSTTRGERAVLDMTSGVMQMEQVAEPVAVATAPTGVAVSATGAVIRPRQRIQALLYPNQIKPGEKDKDGGHPAAPAVPASTKPAPDAGGSAATKAKRPEAADGWSSRSTFDRTSP